MNSNRLADEISQIILTKKGYDTKILDLRKLTTIADYFVICSADSDIQVKAISDEIEKKLGEKGIKCYHREGDKSLRWVLMDYFDVIAHIFHNEARSFYNLEKLWGDAPSKLVEDELSSSQ